MRLVCVIPTELIPGLEAARDRAQREGLERRSTSPEAVHNGQLLEVLIASYLAGPEYPEDTWTSS